MSLNVESLIERQLTAMRSDQFELLLLRFGEKTEGGLKKVSYQGLLRQVKWLKALNVRG